MPIKIHTCCLFYCLLLLIVIVACQPSDTATPTAQATPPPRIVTSIATIAAPVTESTIQLKTLPNLPITDTIKLAPFTVHLPTQWPVLHSRDIGWVDQLHHLQRTHPHLAYYIQQLLPASAPETKLIVAWTPSFPSDTIIVAAITPAEDLSLQGYLSAITEELEQSRLIVGSAVTVHEAELRYDLHPDNIPLALIHYTLVPKTKEQKTVGYQAAMLDSSTDQLLLLTIITPEPVAAESQALIEALFRTITIE